MHQLRSDKGMIKAGAFSLHGTNPIARMKSFTILLYAGADSSFTK